MDVLPLNNIYTRKVASVYISVMTFPFKTNFSIRFKETRHEFKCRYELYFDLILNFKIIIIRIGMG